MQRADYGRRDDYFDRHVPGVGGSICDQLKRLPGYDAAKVQALTHDADGNCSWIDIVECEPEA